MLEFLKQYLAYSFCRKTLEFETVKLTLLLYMLIPHIIDNFGMTGNVMDLGQAIKIYENYDNTEYNIC